MNYKDSSERRRRNKKRENCIIGIAALALLIAACGAPQNIETKEEAEEWPEEHHSCGVQELSGYLYEHTSVSASPYASAEITIKDYEGEWLENNWDADIPLTYRFAGEADVTWQFYNSLAEMEEALNEAAMQEMDGNSLYFLYYTFPMAENDHALDLYYDLKSRFDTEEHPLSAWSADKGKLFYYTQETLKEGDGYEYTSLQYRSSKVNLYVKDRIAYGLTLMNASSEDDDETLEYVFHDVFQHYDPSPGGWGLEEENLYWIDHEERLTELENPKRSFLEVRGIDESWEDVGQEGIMRYFGLLVEADYELPLTEDGRMLSLHFSLAEEDETSVDEKEMSAEEESAEFRYNLSSSWVGEPYDMTVTDMETGEVLQERRVSLSIELADTITYPDLNGDGYADMCVAAPVHSSGANYISPDYFLWDSQTEEFVWKTKKEVENSRLAVANGLTEEEQEEKSKRERRDPFAPVQELPEWAEPEDYIKLTGDKMLEYEVQEGDSLWRISEHFYGTENKWTTIVRAEDAPKDPNYLLVGETVFLPEFFYIRIDPYSKGATFSEGSFQIDQPDGFAYYWLDGDLEYRSWEKENQINYLPVSNPVRENPLHEPEDWEAFQAEAIRCSEELCPGRVSNLTFEKYHMEDGYDLYGYYFEYDTGEKILEYVDFFKLGKNNMSEVIGVREQEPNTVLLNTVRYMAASFIDYGGKPTMGWGGIQINVGFDQWKYQYIHNLFEAAREQFEK